MEVCFVWPFIRDLARIAFTRELLKHCKDCGLAFVLTSMPRTTAAYGPRNIRPQPYSETFRFNHGILSSCDLVAMVIISNHNTVVLISP